MLLWTSGNFFLGISSLPQMPLKPPCEAWGDAGGCWAGQGLCRDLGASSGGHAGSSWGGLSLWCGSCHCGTCHERDFSSATRGAGSWGSHKFILTSNKGFSSTLGKEGGFGKLEINL